MTIPTFEGGTTPRFRLATKDYEGSPVTPTQGPTCKIFDLTDPTSPLASLTITPYGAGLYEAYWKIPESLDVEGHAVTCPKCGTVIADYKICYAEWSWTWDGKEFVERAPFKVVIIEE